MGADHVVDFGCGAKQALGGTQGLVDMLKARDRAAAVREQGGTKVTLIKLTPQGQTQVEASVADLEAECAPLAQHQAGCSGCPANWSARPYGCVGYLPYPVTAAWERSLVERLQSADSPGGVLLLSAIKDFKYDGAPVAEMRAAGMFEMKHPLEKVVKKGFLGSTTVNGNQLFEALFAVGPELNPGHCAMVLMWLGVLETQGYQAAMRSSTPEERKKAARLLVTDDNPACGLLVALYTAWVLDVPLLMDA